MTDSFSPFSIRRLFFNSKLTKTSQTTYANLAAASLISFATGSLFGQCLSARL